MPTRAGDVELEIVAVAVVVVVVLAGVTNSSLILIVYWGVIMRLGQASPNPSPWREKKVSMGKSLRQCNMFCIVEILSVLLLLVVLGIFVQVFVWLWVNEEFIGA